MDLEECNKQTELPMKISLGSFSSDECAVFFKESLISSLTILANDKLQPEALFTICKLAFSYFDKVSEANFQILVDCCDALIDLMWNKRILHQYESALETKLLSAICKQPFLALGRLIVKFVGLTSTQFNSSRLIRKVLLGCSFTTSHQICLMQQLIRHRSFEKDFIQILADVLLQRAKDTPVDDDTLRFLARLVLIRQPPTCTSDESVDNGLICLPLASGSHSPEELQETVQWITQPLSDSQTNFERKLCSALCLPHMRLVIPLRPSNALQSRPISMEYAATQLAREMEIACERLKHIQLEGSEFVEMATYLLAVFEAWFSCSTMAERREVDHKWNKVEIEVDAEFLLSTAL